jgi:NhaA family Na+:H+ antiporter
MTPRREPVERILSPFQAFVRAEAGGGVLLLFSAAIALVWANSAWADGYFELWNSELAIELTDYRLAQSLHEWINEGLMVLFFFLVGLEIKREILVGELATPKSAAFPIAAALGGMLVPAVIYAAWNPGGPESRGWGIPMATDIAFALGVMALLGDRVPTALKVFLAALAIVDDIGAVVVIAAFYSSGVSWGALAGAGGLLLLMLGAARLGVRSPLPYALLGIGVWLAFLASGIHPTVAGVLAAFTIPARTRLEREEFLEEGSHALTAFEAAEPSPGSLISGQQISAVQALETAAERVQTPLQRFENGLAPWVLFAILPLFALANAGVHITLDPVALAQPVTLGVILGLLLGKPIGVTAFAWLAVRLRLAEPPADVSWGRILGVACLAGIGFTMSLFITAVALDDESLATMAKIGVLAGSLLSGLLGWALIAGADRHEAAAS